MKLEEYDQVAEIIRVNNKALLKVYGVSFAVIIIIIIGFLALYNNEEMPIVDSIAPGTPSQSLIESNDNVAENIILSTSQESDLNNQLEQANLNTIELQNELINITDKYENLVNSFEENNSDTFGSDQLERIELSQIVTLTTALSMANQRITDLENELQNSSAAISEMQITIDELNEYTDERIQLLTILDEYADERIQLLTILDEREDLINQLQETAGFQEYEQEQEELENLPIFTASPVYPRRALSAGITGWTLVRFTIIGDGSVINPVVIESDPPGVFDATSLRAISNFRYNPRFEDGVQLSYPGEYFFRYGIEETPSLSSTDTETFGGRTRARE